MEKNKICDESSESKRMIFLFLLFVVVLGISFLPLGLDMSDAGYSLSRYHLFSGQGLDTNFLLSNKLGSMLLRASNNALTVRVFSYVVYCLSTVISLIVWHKFIDSNRSLFIAGIVSLLLAFAFPMEIIHNAISCFFLVLLQLFMAQYLREHSPIWTLFLACTVLLSTLFRITNLVFFIPLFFIIYSIDKNHSLLFALYMFSFVLLSIIAITLLGKSQKLIAMARFLFGLLLGETKYGVRAVAFHLFRDGLLIVCGVLFYEKVVVPREFNFFKEKRILTTFVLMITFIIVFFMSNYKQNIFMWKSISIRALITALVICYLHMPEEAKEMGQLSFGLFFFVGFTSGNAIYYYDIAMILVMPIFVNWCFLSTKNTIKPLMLSVLLANLFLIVAFPYRDEMIINLTENVQANGLRMIKTSKKKAASLSELTFVLKKINWKECRLLTNGSIPMISYLTGAYSVHNTTWPDLETYSFYKYENELQGLRHDLVIVMTKVNMVNNYWLPYKFDRAPTAKEKLISKEIERRNLKIFYQDQYFVVWK